MAASRAEQLTTNFYNWEKRGRGWHVFKNHIHIEPVIVPFFYAYDTPIEDDAKKPSLFGQLRNTFMPPKREEVSTQNEDIYEVQAYEVFQEEPLTVISIVFPETLKLNR
jgi:hypothetical protein